MKTLSNMLAALVLAAMPWTALGATFKVVHSFAGTDGAYPQSTPVLVGNIGYATTWRGGAAGDGAVVEYNAGKVTVLHNFGDGSVENDGKYPVGGVIAANGALYGTTLGGGAYGAGAVYKITTSGAVAILHSLNTTDGASPYAALYLASDGNLYGTTEGGGAYVGGVLFKITPKGAYTVLHSFGAGTDGANPYGQLTEAHGILYGTTEGGGANQCGTIYTLTLSGSYSNLYQFGATSWADAFCPFGGLTVGTDGLYGTGCYGGTNDLGAIYRITPSGVETVTHSFARSEGMEPQYGSLALVGSTLYGTCCGGGSGSGTVFSITQSGTVTVLHSFNGNDGVAPTGGLIYVGGMLYGLTSSGGTKQDGVVFGL